MKMLSFRAALVVLLAAISSTARALPIDLDKAGPGYWGVLQLSNKKVSSSHTAGNLTGAVGVNDFGQLVLSGGADVLGEVFLGTGATVSLSGGATTGTVHQDAAANALLDEARADALAAASAASDLLGNAIADITTNFTLAAPGVYDLAKIDLNSGETLTLSGGANDYFVFNISGQLKLNSDSHVVLSGGLTWDNVLFNIEGTSDVSINGSSITGIILSPYAKGVFVNIDGLLVGEFIGGNDISFASGARIVNNYAPPVPESGSTFALLLLAGVGLTAVRRRPAK